MKICAGTGMQSASQESFNQSYFQRVQEQIYML